ncbi:hypothetical protein VE04_09217, partial [Pseudogymnoascus sp. 24MN13]
MNSFRIARAALRVRAAAMKAPVQRRGYAEAVSDKIKLSLNLPHQKVYTSHDVVQVNIAAESGEMGLLANHVPSIEQLKPGLIEVIEESAGSKQFFLSGGFAVMNPNSVLSINAVEGFPLEDFSIEAVRSQLTEAQKVASGNGSATEIAEANIEIERGNATSSAVQIDHASIPSLNPPTSPQQQTKTSTSPRANNVIDRLTATVKTTTTAPPPPPRRASSSPARLHERATSGHFGLGLGIHRRNFGLDLDLVREVPRQIASEVPKQIGRYLDGRGEVRDEVAAPPPAPAPEPAPASPLAPAPQQPLAVDKSATLQLANRYSCHICRFINEEIERCASCGHRLCIDCEWLMPIAKTDGAAQEFAIYEDSDAMEARNMEFEDQRAENVYTPSEFEQENYVDSPDTPDLPPNVWARQAALAKAHYTTPQSPTSGSPYYTTTQSPTVRSPPPSPVDLSYLSASDYPEPLRLEPSPVRPPGPRSRRVVRDNPFVVADQLSAHHGRVMRVDSEAGIRSRDGQASPQPGRYSARARALARRMEEREEDRHTWLANKSRGEQPSPQPGRYSDRALASREREEDKRDSQRRMWQTNRVRLPGFGAEREGARRASRGEKVSAAERAPRTKKLDPVMSGTLTPSESKAGGGNVVEGGGFMLFLFLMGVKMGMRKDIRNRMDLRVRLLNRMRIVKFVLARRWCRTRKVVARYAHFTVGVVFLLGVGMARLVVSSRQVHPYPTAGSGYCGHVRNEQAQTVLWVQ